MALGLFQHYLLSECHLTLLSHITETEIQGWLISLEQQPTTRGKFRAAGTIASYQRSARAFFQWAMRHTSLKSTPFAHLPLPKAESLLLEPLEQEKFHCLLLACQPLGETDVKTAWATARNQAVLWVIADTGMHVSEVSGLHLSDVNQESGILTIKEKGSEPRLLPLGQDGLHALLWYLDQPRPEIRKDGDQRDTSEEPLFLSEVGHPLTDNGITLLFGRLRKRSGIIEEPVTPSRLRDTFAVRYLQAGGEPAALRAILGLTGMELVKRYEQISTQQIKHEPQKEPIEERQSRPMAVPQKSKQRRRRSSSAETRNYRQPGTDRTHRRRKKKTAPNAEEDP